jgi:hypothetical protein
VAELTLQHADGDIAGMMLVNGEKLEAGFPNILIQLFLFTANCSTEGANENFPIWDVFKEFPISRSVLNGFG